MRYRIELPKKGGAAEVRSFIADWLECPALRELVEAEGGSWPTGDLEARLGALHAFSSRWDFRSGAERLKIRAEADEDHRNSELIKRAGEAMGLATAGQPVGTDYGHGLVLGGTALASIYRVKRLFDMRNADIDIHNPVVLTALREIKSPELDLVRARPEIASIVVDAVTEFDVMAHAVSYFSGAEPTVTFQPNDNPHLASATARVGDTTIVAAPSAEPNRRPNTLDNYGAYVDYVGEMDRVLVITSSIYLPYQFFIAIQAFGWSLPRTIEAIGFPPEWMRGVLTGPENVLQELRSAFFAAHETTRMLGASV